jgi:hypothetical protein
LSEEVYSLYIAAWLFAWTRSSGEGVATVAAYSNAWVYSSSNLLCSTIAFLLYLAWLLTFKHKYSQCVKDLACKCIFYINKESFLSAFKDAFFDVFTEANCCKAFKALDLVPLDNRLYWIALRYSCTYNSYQRTCHGSPKHQIIHTSLDSSQS